MSTETTMTGLPPDSEMVPSSHAKCTSILRVAHHFHLSHPRIAYLCVHGALEESKRIDPLSLTRGVRQFRFSLERWIEKNDAISEQGRFQPNTDVPDLQTFCLDYYEKTIVTMIKITSKEIDSSAYTSSSTDNQVSTSVNVRALGDQLIYACEIARVLFKVLELLSKDVPLTFGSLEAYTEVKQLAKIFRLYNIIPQFDNNENHSIRRLPELQTAINALNHHPWSAPTHENKRDEEIILGMLEQVDNPSASGSHERPACQESEPAIPEMETADKPAQLSIQVPELLIFLFSVHVLIFLVLFVVFIINLCAEPNNQNGAV